MLSTSMYFTNLQNMLCSPTLINIPGRPLSNLEFSDFSGSVLPYCGQYLWNLQPTSSTSVHAPYNDCPLATPWYTQPVA